MKKTILQGRSTHDGAGVKLTRIFANNEAEMTDPFLLLDHFGSDNPEDYMKGFPWHPHRGIETVTYMFGGKVEHGDSMGNSGIIGPGDIQWMTAGSGIIHQEMPKQSVGKMHGLQLWVNLPAKSKMMAPRYRGIFEKGIPVVAIDGGEVRVIAGTFNNIKGPVKDLVVDVNYFDVRLQKGNSLLHEIKNGYTGFCFIIDGAVEIDSDTLEENQLFLCTDQGTILTKAQSNIHYIFVTGQRLHEPIAWGGPIVMNTREELDRAFEEIEDGTFIKSE